MVSSFVFEPTSYCTVCQMNERFVESITRLHIEIMMDSIDITISDENRRPFRYEAYPI